MYILYAFAIFSPAPSRRFSYSCPSRMAARIITLEKKKKREMRKLKRNKSGSLVKFIVQIL